MQGDRLAWSAGSLDTSIHLFRTEKRRSLSQS
jgi:hypothetical protein